MKHLQLHLALAVILAAPLPPDLPMAPTLTGHCHFGDVIQTGKNLIINGGESWTATGYVRADGLVILWWINAGRHATAVYSLDGDTLNGHWGWSDRCELDEANADICGDIQRETIRIERK